jgi:hypothetical protein
MIFISCLHKESPGGAIRWRKETNRELESLPPSPAHSVNTASSLICRYVSRA